MYQYQKNALMFWMCGLLITFCLGCEDHPYKSTAGEAIGVKKVLIPRHGGIIEVQIIKMKPDEGTSDLVLMDRDKMHITEGKRYIVQYNDSELPESTFKGMFQLRSVKEAGDARMMSTLDIENFNNEPIDLKASPKSTGVEVKK